MPDDLGPASEIAEVDDLTPFEALSSEERRLLNSLIDHGVELIVIGGYAVRVHGYRRDVEDLDLVIQNSSENLSRLGSALAALGVEDPEKTAQHLAEPMAKIRWNNDREPFVDLMSSAEPFSYADLYARAVMVQDAGLCLRVICKDQLIENKRVCLFDENRQSKRNQDNDDLHALQDTAAPV